MNFDLSPSEKKETKKEKSRSVRLADSPSNHEDDVFIRGPAKVVVVEEENSAQPDIKLDLDQPERLPDPPSEPPREITKVPELSPRQKQLLIPRSHMTRAEKKRLQWELENAETERMRTERLRSEEIYKGQSPRRMQTENSQGTQYTTSNIVASERKPRKELTNNTKTAPDSKKSEPAVVEPSFIPGLGEVGPETNTTQRDPVSYRGTDQPSYRNGGNNYKQYGNNANQQLTAENTSSTARTEYKPLSKAELKRLQWESERGRSTSPCQVSLLLLYYAQ